jgi:hypothetical protein
LGDAAAEELTTTVTAFVGPPIRIVPTNPPQFCSQPNRLLPRVSICEFEDGAACLLQVSDDLDLYTRHVRLVGDPLGKCLQRCFTGVGHAKQSNCEPSFFFCFGVSRAVPPDELRYATVAPIKE